MYKEISKAAAERIAGIFHCLACNKPITNNDNVVQKEHPVTGETQGTLHKTCHTLLNRR